MRRLRGFTGVLGGLLGIGLGVIVLLMGVFNAGVSAPPAGAQASSCGNSVLESGEECDPPGSSCTGAFAGGTCQNDCTCSSPTPALLRHFQCYEVRPPQRFDDRTVDLGDQFRASYSASVRKVFSVCAPADKNGEDPDALSPGGAHLTNYGIKAGKGSKVFNQKVTNQFGTINVDAVKPARLLVPSIKSLTGPPSSPAPGVLDHFACYKVKRTSGSPKFVKASATIETQFETVTINLAKPLRLCTPVNKNGEDPTAPNRPAGIQNHLMCYRMKAATGFPTTNVFINNQFGQQSYALSQRREFCVPSTKNDFGPTTTSTSSSSSTSTSSSSTSSSTSTSTSLESTTSTSSTTTTSTSAPTTTSTSTTTTSSTTTSVPTTTTTSTTSTTIPGCCSNTRLGFTTTPGAGNCGTTVNVSGTVQTNLNCGALYTGGGSGTVPQPFQIPSAALTLTSIDACNPLTGAITLGGLSSGETGSNENCSDVNCLFGPPLPIPNTVTTAISVCVVNRVSTNASGTTNCLTGVTNLNLPLASELFVVGDGEGGAGIQPCPTCQGGFCQSGANSGGACTSTNTNLGTAGPTSNDCPPDPTKSIGFLPIPFNLTTGATTVTSVAQATQLRVFCGFCNDFDLSGSLGNGGFGKCVGGPNAGLVCDTTATCGGGVCSGFIPCTSPAQCTEAGPESREACRQAGGAAGGAFQKAAANTITETGSPAGNMTDGLGHPSILVSNFCIPPTFDGAVDANGGLPGPGAVALSGNAQLLP